MKGSHANQLTDDDLRIAGRVLILHVLQKAVKDATMRIHSHGPGYTEMIRNDAIRFLHSDDAKAICRAFGRPHEKLIAQIRAV